MKINKPKLPLNSTPVRTRDVQPSYHSGQGMTPTRQHENGMYLANLSPNKLNATKKPLAQKGYQSTQVQQQMPHIQLNQRRDSQATRPLAMLSKRAVDECSTHPNKEATFKISVDDEVMYYCTECASLLSTQGFKFEEIVTPGEINVYGANPILSSRRQSYTPQAPVFQPQKPPQQPVESNYDNFTLDIDPQLTEDPRYLEIQDLVSECKQTLVGFDENIEGFSKIQDHYNEQQQLVEQFYDAMIDYLKHIKGEHINLISNEGRKYVQIAEIESVQLQEDKENIENILTDISDNVNDIVTNVDEESFIQCMNQYKGNLERYNHRVEEQRSTFEEISKIQHGELEVKLQEFRTTVNDLFGVKESQSRLAKQVPKKSNVAPQGIRNLTGGMLNSNGTHNMTNMNNFRSNTMGNMGGNIGGNNGLYGGFNNGGNSVNQLGHGNGIGNVSGVLGMIKNNSNGTTIPKANNNGPFRTLFGDDGTAQSPQFKEI